MSFYYILPAEFKIQEHSFNAPKLFKTQFDIFAIKEKNTKAYLYVFFALQTAFPIYVSGLFFMYGEQEYDYYAKSELELVLSTTNTTVPKEKIPQITAPALFLRPKLIMMLTYLENPNIAMQIKSTMKEMTILNGEPIQITEQEYEELKSRIDCVEPFYENEVNKEIHRQCIDHSIPI